MLYPCGNKDHGTWANFASHPLCFRNPFARKDIDNFFLVRMGVGFVDIAREVFGYVSPFTGSGLVFFC